MECCFKERMNSSYEELLIFWKIRDNARCSRAIPPPKMGSSSFKADMKLISLKKRHILLTITGESCYYVNMYVFYGILQAE